MNVTYVGINYAPEPTGIGVYATALAEGLADRGHRVEVITGFPHYPKWRVDPGYRGWRRIKDEGGVRVTRLRHYVPRRPSVLRRAVMETTFGLRALTSRWGHPDVVMVASPALISSALAIARARVQGVPSVAWVQDIYTLGFRQTGGRRSSAQRALRALESWVVGHATAVVTIHDRFRSFVVSELGSAPERVEVVRNWTHLPERLPQRSEQTRERHGWAPDQLVVLHAGNMGAKQGLDNVVEAARLAEDRDSRVHFVLLGDGNQRQALEKLAAGTSVQFIDPLPDAEFQEVLVSADVLLVHERPGLTEMSVPSKLTSYFSTGLPVLGAVDPGSVTASELDAAGGALRVAAADPHALLAAAEALASEPQRADAMGAKNQDFQRRHLSQGAAFDSFTRILGGLRRPRRG